MAKPTRYTEEMIAEYFRSGDWDYTTNAYYWDRNAELYPDKEAVVDSRNRLTWSKAKQLIDRIALGLLESGTFGTMSWSTPLSMLRR
jgi:non-ribosomal peptide synthetase component E (peptide arylation enzyme)